MVTVNTDRAKCCKSEIPANQPSGFKGSGIYGEVLFVVAAHAFVSFSRCPHHKPPNPLKLPAMLATAKLSKTISILGSILF